MSDDEECPDCGGCGEVQCVNLGDDGDDGCLPCPTCGAREHEEQKSSLLAEIATLRACIVELEEALNPFAEASKNFDKMPIKNPEDWMPYAGVESSHAHRKGAITVGDLRRAAAAMEGK